MTATSEVLRDENTNLAENVVGLVAQVKFLLGECDRLRRIAGIEKDEIHRALVKARADARFDAAEANKRLVAANARSEADQKWLVRLETALAINYTNDFLWKLSYELSAYMAPADLRAPRWERVGPRG